MSTEMTAEVTAQMTAVVARSYGGPDVLQVSRVARPSIAPHEVLIQVRAAGLDRGTWHLLTGRPYLMRLMGFGWSAPKNPVVGHDVAGDIVEVGSAVTRFRVGDEVFGISRGSFAEFAAAPEDKLALKPASISFEQAAAVATSGLTALQGLRDAGRLQAGQRILITGASGGVGSHAVQLAKAMGAHVTGVCRTSKVAFVRGLGADDVIDYTQEDVTDGTRSFDVILDLAGNTSLRRIRRALTSTGTAVIAGGEGKGAITGGVDRQMRGMLLSPFISQRLTGLMCKESGADLERLAQLMADGSLTPAVDRTYPLDEAAEAMRDLEQGRVQGKAVIQIRSAD